MARPTDKQGLITLSIDNYNELLQVINSFSEKQRVAIFPFEDRDRNIRDVITHLHEWHLMMIDWYQQGMAGHKPIMPKQGYTWKTLPALNQLIWEKYQTTLLDSALEKLAESHQFIHTLIDNHSNEQLFTRKYYHWTGTTSLGAYFISSSTSSHYDWAIKKLKKYKKTIMK